MIMYYIYSHSLSTINVGQPPGRKHAWLVASRVRSTFYNQIDPELRRWVGEYLPDIIKNNMIYDIYI